MAVEICATSLEELAGVTPSCLLRERVDCVLRYALCPCVEISMDYFFPALALANYPHRLDNQGFRSFKFSFTYFVFIFSFV
jgi:hypothetical protein